MSSRLSGRPSADPRPAQPPGASSLLVNLAAAPFVNRRPVQRFTLAMWILGALLAGVNTFLWLQYRHESTALRARLAATRSEIERRSRDIVSTGEELGRLKLAAQNDQVDFLNQRIAERTFPWSLLFERIATTLPDGVRLVGLNPVFQDRGRRTARGAPAARPEEEMVDFKIRGVARSDQELYRLIDAFFSAPAFERPRLYQESSAAGEVEFTVDVRYRPRLAPEESHRPAAAVDLAGTFDLGQAAPADAGDGDDESAGVAAGETAALPNDRRGPASEVSR
ncbi:MAG TPA: hypothetical protein VMS86_00460 [Thermoanaerobaculia bacterium]|nr:hypothetical protein [Thermoanaerobaculia bacterium]